MLTSLDGATDALAAHVVALEVPTLPSVVARQAQRVLTDTIGVMLASSRESGVSCAVRAYPVLEAGPGTVVGRGKAATVEQAALINGIGAHDIELDDVHTSSRTHPACVIVPAVLAAAEAMPTSTPLDIVAAVVAGFDVEARVSKAMRVQPQFNRGFHPSGVCGAIGAAVAAARVFGLAEHQLRAAIALAAAQSGGLLTFEDDSTHMLKSFNTGAAARSGVVAATLAANGFRGADDVLTGRYNVLTSFGPSDPDYVALGDGLGVDFEICNTSLKRHACCSHTHAAIDALLQLRDVHEFNVDDVEQIHVRLSTAALPMIDGNPLWTHNIQYVLAVALRYGRVGHEHFAERYTRSTDLIELSRRVRLGGSRLLQSRFPNLQGAIVEVITNDGSRLALEKRSPVGTPDEPMPDEMLRSKFFTLATRVLSRERTKMLWELLGRFGQADGSAITTPDLFRLVISDDADMRPPT